MTINRRKFIAASATAPIAGMATSQSTDPHPQWHRDWKQAMQDFENEVGDTGAGKGFAPVDDAYQRSWNAAEKICMTQADTLEGVEAQLAHFLDNFGEYCLNNISNDLDRRLATHLCWTVRLGAGIVIFAQGVLTG